MACYLYTNSGMRYVILFAAIPLVATGCANPSVNGTKAVPQQPCTGTWVATVNNSTNRYYDLYVGSRLVGTSEPRSVSRIVMDPALGQVTPQLRVAVTSREEKGPQISSQALRMSCEP